MSRKPFKMRSGNSPLFKKMGSTPAKNMLTGSYSHKFEDDSKQSPTYLKQFGIGKGTSPIYKKKLTYEEALKNDPDLAKHIKERDKHDPGSAEYEAAQAKVNAAYETTRSQKLKEAQIKNLEKDNTQEEKETDTSDVSKGIEEGIKKHRKGLGGVGRAIKGAASVGFAGLTGGLDEVYGSGKWLPGGEFAFSDDTEKEKKKKDDKTGEEKVEEIINKT